MITVDRAIRTRWCNKCHQEIKAGTYHIRYGSNGLESKNNACQSCLEKMVNEVKERNHQV